MLRRTSVTSVAELAETLIAAVDGDGLGVTVLAQRGDQIERIWASQGMCQLTGYTEAELREISAGDLIAPADRERMLGLRDLVLGGGSSPARVETAIVTRTGEIIPVELGVATVLRPTGAVAVMLFRDLRESRRIEAALRESEARFRSLAEACPDSITVLSRGRFVYANPAAASVLGFDSVDELVAQMARDVGDTRRIAG